MSATSSCFQPRRPKKRKGGGERKAVRQAADTDASTDEAQFLAELRSGVSSILSGLEPEHASSSTARPREGKLPKDKARDSNKESSDNEKITERVLSDTVRDTKATDPVARTCATNKKVRRKKTVKSKKDGSCPPDTQSNSGSRVGGCKTDITVCALASSSKGGVEPLLSSKRKKRLRHKYAAKKDRVGISNAIALQDSSAPESKEATLLPNSLPGAKKASSKRASSVLLPSSQDVREKALERLRAAQFRLLNEELYTSESTDAVRSFEEDPGAFHVYHKGFEHQVSKWPVNPVDVIIESLRSMPKSTVIADLGCGEAKIAQALTSQKVHSFDLIALNDHVTVCDMSRVSHSKISFLHFWQLTFLTTEIELKEWSMCFYMG